MNESVFLWMNDLINPNKDRDQSTMCLLRHPVVLNGRHAVIASLTRWSNSSNIIFAWRILSLMFSPQDSHLPSIGRMLMPRPNMCHTSSLQTPNDKEQTLSVSVSVLLPSPVFLPILRSIVLSATSFMRVPMASFRQSVEAFLTK